MARQPALRTVRCYHCSKEFEVGAKAITVSCPHCYQRVAIEDMVVRSSHSGGKVQTCGKITIAERARFTAMSVQASGGLEINGVLNASQISTDRIHLGPGGRMRGDCRARTFTMDAGARIEGGYFEIGVQPTDADAEADTKAPSPPSHAA
ncbi:MAG: polymer-forming cytoskeletal protein [Phycisphaeraceae bacterium]|nr:MAG: polymer-forming cytoskeletal protein [Phycisphaeraceae bacterium]